MATPEVVNAQLEPQPRQKEQKTKAPVVTKNPELLESVQPEYAEEAQKQGLEGVVTLKVVLDATGFVQEATVEKSVHPLLDDAALEAAYQLVFSPAEVDGVPAPIALLFSFTFEMKAPEPEEIAAIEAKPVVNFEDSLDKPELKNRLSSPKSRWSGSPAKVKRPCPRRREHPG